VESKIRQLVMKLELVDMIKIAHPYVKGFERVFYCVSAEESNAVMNGILTPDVSARNKEAIDGIDGAAEVWTSFFFIGLNIESPKSASARCSGAVTR
jgi:poly(A) polymerase